MREATNFTQERYATEKGMVLGGIIITAQGERRQPDRSIPKYISGLAMKNEVIEIWDAVDVTETALRIDVRRGRIVLDVALPPEVVTPKMLASANAILAKTRSTFADVVDWADDYAWQYDPLAGLGWDLEHPEEPSKRELCKMLVDANYRIGQLPFATVVRPHAKYYKVGNDWTMLIDAGFGTCMAHELNLRSVRRFLQMERDFICHCKVLEEREQTHETYSTAYERSRSFLEGLGYGLIDVGHDGFILIKDGHVDLFGLNETDLGSFGRFCDDLKE